MRFCLIILAALLLRAQPVNSQTRELRNAIHAKINVVDYGQLFNSEIRPSQGFELGYFRNIAPFLNAGLPFKMSVAKLPGAVDNTVTTSLDLVFHLGQIKETAKISPYFFGGAGVFAEKLKNRDIHFPFGAGLNFRISKFAFVNLQGEFRKAMHDNRDNLQLGLGFSYLLHKIELPPPPPPDTDGDSIPDIADRCPDLKGPASALGCPDKDADGLGDNEDKCPDQIGELETLGCPDADKDGVADADDKCPQAPGTVEGCPDRDGDNVPDRLDHCVDLPGTIDGCPDRDGDNWHDLKDECPDQPGPWNGCPDEDKDGVPDKDDRCPTEPGNVANKGCPEKKDSDGDGFEDFLDECPADSGAVAGCPDRDGDKFQDKKDDCPDLPGDLAGCPDQDKDGVADKNDPCPTLVGTAKGCPDADADGTPDKDDPCPALAGPNGLPCPDTDGDGIADNLDKCPATPGVAADNGCPEIKKETKERLAFATKAVQFESGKATLKMESYAVLDELFGILKQYPDYKLAISGHTDDLGDAENNLQLSANRAKACHDYLVFRGTKSERLRFAGFGEMRPIAQNSTIAGREMNRRVEFELVAD